MKKRYPCRPASWNKTVPFSKLYINWSAEILFPSCAWKLYKLYFQKIIYFIFTEVLKWWIYKRPVRIFRPLSPVFPKFSIHPIAMSTLSLIACPPPYFTPCRHEWKRLFQRKRENGLSLQIMHLEKQFYISVSYSSSL